MDTSTLRALRASLVAAIVLVAVVQVIGLPWLSGVVAADLPDEAYMRWPVLAIAELGLLCVQAALVSGTRLLTLAQRGELATPRARRWVDGLSLAFLGMSLTCVAMLVYQQNTVSGPPPLFLGLLAGVPSGIGLARLSRRLHSARTVPTTSHPEHVGAS